MGVHIIIQKQDGTEHPDWDFIRQGDDRENARRVADQGVSSHGNDAYGDCLYRPKEGEQFNLVGPRGAEMNEILSDPDWWVRLSY